MNKIIEENHKKYLERIKLFNEKGFDIISERKILINRVKPLNGKILEIGTGKGHFALALAQENKNFISIDKSADEINFAKLNLEYYNLSDKVEFKIMDAEKLQFPDNSFEIIFSISMLHHLENPYPFINESLRVLKSAGRFVLSDFSRHGMDIINKIHQTEGRTHFESSININDIKIYLKEKSIKFNDISSDFQDSIIIYK